MSQPQKYTLPRVLKIVRGHVGALNAVGMALESSEGADAQILAMVGERALIAAREPWDLEQQTPLDEDARAAWEEKDRSGGPSQLWYSLWALPTLAMAVEFAAINPNGAMPPVPDGTMPVGRRWTWCEVEAQRIAEVLMEWVTAHEKDVTPPSDGGDTKSESGSGNGPVSQTEKETEEAPEPESKRLMPMEAFETMADALRPLVSGLADFEPGWGRYSCFVDESGEDCELTHEGRHRITEMASIATKEAIRLRKVERTTINTYLPHWCGCQLYDTRATVVA